jgi:hypothetical protein
LFGKKQENWPYRPKEECFSQISKQTKEFIQDGIEEDKH